MNKKMLAVVVAISVCFAISTPIALADDSTVTGTFNPTTSFSASILNATMAFGNMALSANLTQENYLINDGDVIIDSTLNMSGDSAALSYVVTTVGAAPSGEDEFAMWYSANATATAVPGGGDTVYAFLTNTSATLMANVNSSDSARFVVSVLATTGSWSVDHAEQEVGITVTYTENT